MQAGRDIPLDEISAGISALDEALHMHDRWSSSLFRSVICRTAPDDRDLADDAHLMCPFGQWYYARQGSFLNRHPGFIAIASEHEDMHRRAARLLRATRANELIAVRDYDSYVHTASRLRMGVVGLKYELQDGLAHRDSLTGATNRIGMLAWLRMQQELVKRDLLPCMIAMMDLDLFKEVNDLQGHPAGDKVLVGVVQYVREHLRPYDRLYRYGGDEFLLCAPGTDLESGCAAAERLRVGLAGIVIDAGMGPSIRVTVSLGATLLAADVPVEVSIARADEALYIAKSAGRNQTRTWSPSIA